jgi:hypothetical protein
MGGSDAAREMPGKPLDRLADHHDLVEHGRLRLEVAEESLLRHALDKGLDQAGGVGISRSVASSRDIACLVSRDNHLGRVQNGLTTHPVGTPFQGAFANQVDGTVQQGGEFLLHLDVGQESPLCVIVEGHEDIDITVRAQVGP